MVACCISFAIKSGLQILHLVASNYLGSQAVCNWAYMVVLIHEFNFGYMVEMVAMAF
jgi:hypothetical protein